MSLYWPPFETRGERISQHILKLRWLKMVARGQSSRQGIVQHQWNVLLLADFEGRTTRVVRNDNIRALLFHKSVDWSPRSCTGVLLFSGPHGPHHSWNPQIPEFCGHPNEWWQLSPWKRQVLFHWNCSIMRRWLEKVKQSLKLRVATHEMTCHLKPCRCTQYCFWEKWRRVKRLLAASSSKPPTQRKSFQSLPGVDQSNLTVDIPGKKK